MTHEEIVRMAKEAGYDGFDALHQRLHDLVLAAYKAGTNAVPVPVTLTDLD